MTKDQDLYIEDVIWFKEMCDIKINQYVENSLTVYFPKDMSIEDRERLVPFSYGEVTLLVSGMKKKGLVK